MPRLLAEIGRLQMTAARYTFAATPTAFTPREDRDHKAILAALHQRDTDRAAVVLARHIRRIGRWIG